VWRDLLAAGLADNFSILEHLCQNSVIRTERDSREDQTQRQGQQNSRFDPDSMEQSSDFDLELLSTCVPLFCANPEREVSFSGEKGKQEAPNFVRRYIWGDMDVLAPEFGDTCRLYSCLLSTAFATVSERIYHFQFPLSFVAIENPLKHFFTVLQALATKATEDFYEDYRSEQLALQQDRIV